MKCDYINLFIHDYIDGYLSKEQSIVIEEHAKKCISCDHKLDEIKSQIDELANLRSPSLSKNFTNSAIDKVEIYHQKPKLEITKKPIYISIAASFLLASAIAFTFSLNESNNFTLKQATTFVNQQKINMVFNTPNDLQNVKFTVILPDDVEMVGHPGRRQVIWYSDLSAGPNLLSVPVISRSNLSGILFTKLEYENSSKIFQVKMNKTGKKHTTKV